MGRSDLLKIKNTRMKFYVIAGLLGIGFVLFQSFLNVIYFLDFSAAGLDYEFTPERLSSLTVIASIMIVPITEELFFRKFSLGGLLENYKPKKAIIISALLFASIHIPFTAPLFDFVDFSLHHAYITFFGGLIAGYLFYKTRSVIPSIVFHAVWNMMTYVI
jgi:membrane protease YdiL (CAAX protease family)